MEPYAFELLVAEAVVLVLSLLRVLVAMQHGLDFEGTLAALVAAIAGVLLLRPRRPAHRRSPEGPRVATQRSVSAPFRRHVERSSSCAHCGESTSRAAPIVDLTTHLH